MEVVAELVGEAAGGPRTVLRTVRSCGPALAVRRTGTPGSEPVRVHLVGTAAGPMGGDVLEVRLRLGPGARLDVHGVAASVVLAGREQARSRLLLDLDVGAGALLTCTLPPVVVTAAAEHEQTTVVRLHGDGRLRLAEHVRLGRHGEQGGWWRGHLDVTRDSAPVLRQTTTLGPDTFPRDLRTVLDTAGTAPASATEDTVVLPLAAGGTLEVTLAGHEHGDMGAPGPIRCAT